MVSPESLGQKPVGGAGGNRYNGRLLKKTANRWRSGFLKKLYISALFSILLSGSILLAKPAEDYYISNYDIINLDFLRTHYNEINSGRAIQFDGTFTSLNWIAPYQYKERLADIGFDVNQYHVLQFSLKEKDDYHYGFPILLFKTQAGDLTELDQLSAGERITLYGKFHKLKKSEYAIEVDILETVKKGGHDRQILVDARVAPTLTPTPTITNTPGPNLFQKMYYKINPKETATPTGTITPQPGQ